MRRLMTMVATGRMDLTPLVTHHFALDDLKNVYELFSHQQDGVLKVAIHPHGIPATAKNAREVVSAIL